MSDGTSLTFTSDVDQDRICLGGMKIPNLSMYYLVVNTNPDIKR